MVLTDDYVIKVLTIPTRMITTISIQTKHHKHKHNSATPIPTGTIKRFIEDKEFGSITQENEGRNVHVRWPFYRRPKRLQCIFWSEADQLPLDWEGWA